MLRNDGAFAAFDDVTATALQNKHPEAPDITLSAIENIESLSCTDEHIVAAILKLLAGGAPGPDGLRPCHLKQFCCLGSGSMRQTMLQTLKDFGSLCIAGQSPPSIRHLLFGASLFALKKKDEGLRPIAVGNTLRRFVSSVCCVALKDQVATMLAPF